MQHKLRLALALLALVPCIVQAATFDVVQGTLPASTTTVDLTSAAMSGVTPEFALCELSAATGNDTSTANATFSIGAAANDGSASQFAAGLTTEDNLATSDSGSQFFTDHIYTIGTTSATAASDGEGVLSFISGGVRVTVDDADTARLINCLLGSGDDIEAEIGLAQYPGSASNNDVTIAHGMGGTPDLAVIVGAASTTTHQHGRAGIGFWGRTAPGETGYSWISADAVAAAEATAILSSTVAIPTLSTNVSADVQSADSTNFVIRGTNSATDYVRVLFLRGVSSQIEARVGNFSSETGTGSDDKITGFTLNVKAGLLIGTQLGSVTSSTSGPASVLSFGMFANNGGGITQGAALAADEDGADPTNANSVTSNTAAQVLTTNAGVIDYVAAVTTMDTEVTFDTTNADSGTNTFVYLAFGTAAAAAGAFDTTPGVASRTSADYTVTGSLSGAGDVDAVVCIKDQTAPTIAQALAHDCTGDVDAKAFDEESPAAGNFDFSLTLAPSDNPDFPIYDVYVTDGTTLVSLVDEYLSAPTGYQFIAPTSIGDESPLDDFNESDFQTLAYDGQTANFTLGRIVRGGTSGAYGIIELDSDSGATGTLTIDKRSGTFQDNEALTDASGGAAVVNGTASAYTDIAVGDILVLPTTVSPSSVTLTAELDGDMHYTAAGKQTALNTLIYDTSAGAYLTLDMDLYFNNNDPSCIGTEPFVVALNSAITPIPLPCSDIDLDTMTSGALEALPAGLVHGATTNETSGTPTVEDEDGDVFSYGVIDDAKALTVADLSIVPVDAWPLTDCVSSLTTDTECAGAILALTFDSVNIVSTYSCSASIAEGYVVSQDPAAGQDISPGDTETLVVSLGACAVPSCLSSTVDECTALVAVLSEDATVTPSTGCTSGSSRIYSQGPAPGSQTTTNFVMTVFCR